MRQTQNDGGLYRPEYEHDACGVGFVADITGYASHDILQKAVEALANLTHRGARDADAKTGDGAGVLTQIPLELFAHELQQSDAPECGPGDLAVGMIFLPRDDATSNDRCRIIIEEAVDHHDLVFIGWRQVPVDAMVLGDTAAAQQPDIRQVLIGRPEDLTQTEFSRTLYLVRRQIERSIRRHQISGCYVCSLSNRTLVYKGMMVAPQLSRFYRDLQDPRYETALAVFHQRYSTNTVPNWFQAQPFRYLAHNGEINTLRGNSIWMRGREPSLGLDTWGSRINRIRPIIDPSGSDSAQLDNVTEALCVAGRDPMHALMMLLPEAHQNIPDVSPDLRGFYEFHDGLCEPWDGPAAIAFSDGDYVGAILDRNGLRPARYKLTDDDVIVMGSEVGMLDVPDSRVVEKGRLGPGQMVVVDTRTGVLLRNDDSKAFVARQRPYIQWVREHMVRLDRARAHDQPEPSVGEDKSALQQQQAAFGYTQDEMDYVLVPMANDGKEPVGSMGDDTPLAVLSRRPQLLYNFFCQRFAQVTNPPIDPMRETLVTCLDVHIGRRGNLFELDERQARLMRLRSPLLLDTELAHLKETGSSDFQAEVLPITADPVGGTPGLQQALQDLCDRVSHAIAEGKTVLILSDRDVSPSDAPIPMLLAVGAVHHYLLREGKRTQTSLVVESGEPREVHHFACLIGYGACAVNPYLACETLADLVEAGRLESGIGYHQALENYRKAVEVGILKILAKMGISNLSSYHGAQLFDAVGLNEEVIERCFAGTSSQVGGIGIDEILSMALEFHRQAFEPGADTGLSDEGIYRYRRDGEYHAYNPPVFKAIHKVADSGSLADFQAYSKLVDNRPPTALRDLMVVRGRRPILVDEVEPVEAICRRFATAAMSHGALSKEAHETLAIAMNRIGGKSNSGEGGEDPARYRRRENGDWANSAIKQVASGRFGVTPGYLAAARELEIKIAQGSKPGEGGQLPGHKVSAEIARIRHSVPGVTLISPPPHHDIYSIEDIAQLI
ncbi:MAG: glutamate synthase large subunit, partial [Candidatus Latescibacteria bacterium]|nr:glutamate synthase large subunit [Candidatus Latescibacterota bacterium]